MESAIISSPLSPLPLSQDLNYLFFVMDLVEGVLLSEVLEAIRTQGVLSQEGTPMLYPCRRC